MTDIASLADEAIQQAAEGRGERKASPGIQRLFVVLHGAYGNLFLSKFQTGKLGKTGGDMGVAAAMLVWDSALARYPADIIESAAERLMSEHPDFAPNLPQMQKICQAILPRKTYAEEAGLPMLPAPAPVEPMKIDFSKVDDGKDWARSILARNEAGDSIKPYNLLCARQAMGLVGKMSWQ